MITTITILGSLVDLNTYINAERRNRFLGAKIKKENTEEVMWQTKNVKPIKNYPVAIEIDWYVKNKKKDPDNVFFSVKFCLDALVENGVLENDGQKQISKITNVIYNDSKQPRIIIRIYEPTSK